MYTAKQNLKNNPTTEFSAILMGAAAPCETRQRGGVSSDMLRLKRSGGREPIFHAAGRIKCTSRGNNTTEDVIV